MKLSMGWGYKEGTGEMVNRLLESQGFRVLGEAKGATLIENNKSRLTYYIWDNGGEAGISLVNGEELKIPGWELPRFVPLTYFSRPLDAVTIVYRIMARIEGREINYEFCYETEQELSEGMLPGIEELAKMYEGSNILN